VYSNRSVANLKLNKFSEAVADASKCIELDSNWVKGHTRKGDALYSSSKFTEAFNAYNAAKRLSPSDASLTEKCELASKAIRSEADRSNASTSRTSSAASPAPPSGILGKIVTYSRYLLILFAIVYLLPLGRNYSSIAFRYAINGPLSLSRLIKCSSATSGRIFLLAARAASH
jgi:tetratricopeptide (TPR) repeat protein